MYKFYEWLHKQEMVEVFGNWFGGGKQEGPSGDLARVKAQTERTFFGQVGQGNGWVVRFDWRQPLHLKKHYEDIPAWLVLHTGSIKGRISFDKKGGWFYSDPRSGDQRWKDVKMFQLAGWAELGQTMMPGFNVQFAFVVPAEL